MFKIADYIRLIITALLLAFVLVNFPSCKQVQYIPITEYRDSVHTIHDSIHIYEKDSVIIKIAGDTVYIDRTKARYRDRFITDTCWVDVEKPVPFEVDKPYIPEWCWWLLGINILIFIIIILYLIARIYFRR